MQEIPEKAVPTEEIDKMTVTRVESSEIENEMQRNMKIGEEEIVIEAEYRMLLGRVEVSQARRLLEGMRKEHITTSVSD